MWIIEVIKDGFRRAFAGDFPSTLAKWFGLAVATAVLFLGLKGFYLSLGMIGGRPILYAAGDSATGIISFTLVVLVWLPLCIGIAYASYPVLKIVGVEERHPDVDHVRITVWNRSSKAITFSSTLTFIDPAIVHHVPAHLRISGSEPP